MASWGLSFLVAMSFWGHQAHGQISNSGDSLTAATPAAAASAAESPGSATNPSNSIGAVASNPTTIPNLVPFSSQWALPPIMLDKALLVQYMFDAPSSQPGNLSLVLCQTNAKGTEGLSIRNTWSVTEVPGKCYAPRVRSSLLKELPNSVQR
jgi:hypothetical protein